MELGSVLHFLQDKTILITGATGFLAKSMNEYPLIPLCFFFFFFMYLKDRTIYNMCTYVLGFECLTVLLEKILRVQPNVKKLYLLLRAADAKSASHRFHNEVQN